MYAVNALCPDKEQKENFVKSSQQELWENMQRHMFRCILYHVIKIVFNLCFIGIYIVSHKEISGLDYFKCTPQTFWPKQEVNYMTMISYDLQLLKKNVSWKCISLIIFVFWHWNNPDSFNERIKQCWFLH